MVAVITGDIINSQRLERQGEWIQPLKKLFNEYGNAPGKWEIFRGDTFQVIIEEPENVLLAALQIKAIIKNVVPQTSSKNKADIDVRIAIGIGEIDYRAKRVTESNGSAFIRSGHLFDTLKKEKRNLAIKSQQEDFDRDMNLYLRLAGIAMDNWTLSAAELMKLLLKNPNTNQTEAAKKLNIKKNSLNYRWHRAYADEILEVEAMFRSKLKNYLQA